MLINVGYLKNNFPNKLAETLNTIILRTDKHVKKAVFRLPLFNNSLEGTNTCQFFLL